MRIPIERIKQRWSARRPSVCEICGEPEKRMNKISRFRLADDHDHQTGKFRGRLCAACNTGLGLFRDDPVLLRLAAEYLERKGRTMRFRQPLMRAQHCPCNSWKVEVLAENDPQSERDVFESLDVPYREPAER